MITVKNAQEIEYMREANRLVGNFLNLIQEHIKPGLETIEIDNIARKYIQDNNVKSNFLNYGGFPATICVSIDDEVVHGVPKKNRYLEEGQIVSVDFGVIYKGYHGDAARTFSVGKITKEKQQLIDVTKESFFKGIENLKAGSRLGDLGYAIQQYAESFGYGVVREYTGHGIGRQMHEDPKVYNYASDNKVFSSRYEIDVPSVGRGARLKENMTIAIEPMINMGDYFVYQDKSGVVKTRDGKPSAHYENTVLIKADGVEILSLT